MVDRSQPDGHSGIDLGAARPERLSIGDLSIRLERYGFHWMFVQHLVEFFIFYF